MFFFFYLKRTVLLHQHWLKETGREGGCDFSQISRPHRISFSSCLGRCRRLGFSQTAEGPFQAGLPSNSGHYLHTQRRKDRAAATAKVIAVVGRGGKQRWENACWICNGKWTNKEVEPSFFSSWPASSSGPLLVFFLSFFLSFCGESIERDRRWRGDLFEKGRSAMETSHASTLPFTASLSSEQVQIISGTSKNKLEKRNMCYATAFMRSLLH